MGAGLPKLLASSGYKSQKKSCNKEEGREKRGYSEEKKKEE